MINGVHTFCNMICSKKEVGKGSKREAGRKRGRLGGEEGGRGGRGKLWGRGRP